MSLIVNFWQRALPALILAVLTSYAFSHNDLQVAEAFFLLHLAVYMIHQMEEHLWPGGFRQFTNAHVFKSDDEDFPVSRSGVALVNIAYVWLPLALAAAAPEKAHIVGVAWFGLSFVNALSHIATSVRFRCYNPGVVTAALGLLPLSTVFFLDQYTAGNMSGASIGLAVVGGVLLHIPVAALFVIPFQLAKKAALARQ